MQPKFIRSKMTGNILSRYDGDTKVITIHRDHLGRPITTATIHSGDYTCSIEHQTFKFIEANPEWYEAIDLHPARIAS